MTQWALARANRNGTKLTDGGACAKFIKPVAHTSCNINPKNHEAGAITTDNFDQRYIFLTFVTVELDEHWRIIAPLLLRVQGSEPVSVLDPKAHGKMNALDPLLSVISFVVDQQRVESDLLDNASSPKSVTPDYFSRMNVMGNARNRVAEKLRNRVAKRSVDSCQKISDPLNISSPLSASDSTSQVNDITKVDKHGRSSRKKPKKKGKHNKRSSKNISVFTEEENIQEISQYDVGHGVNLHFSSATDLIVKSPEVEECTLLGSAVNTDAVENIEYLNPKGYSATSKLCVHESDVAEESHKTLSCEDSLSEASNSNIRGWQEGSSDHATSTPRSVESFHDALSPFSLKSADRSSHGSLSIGNSSNCDVTCISHRLLEDGRINRENLNVSVAVSNILASKEENETNPSDCGISDGTNCSTTSSVAPSGVKCSSHENACNLSEDILENVHVYLENFTKNSTDSADRISWSSGSCNSIEEDEFIPIWKARRRNKSNKGSSGSAQRFNSSLNMHARGGKDNNHSGWQVSEHGGNGSANVQKDLRHGCLPEGDVQKSWSSCIGYGSGQRKSKQEKSSRCMPLCETSVESDSREGEISKTKSSDTWNLKPTLESEMEQNSHPKKHLLVRNGLKYSKVRTNAFHTGKMEIAKQSTHNKESASENSHHVTCSILEGTEGVLTDSCSSYVVQDTETDLTGACRVVEPAWLVENPFENELKSDNETIFWNDLTQSSCPSPANGDHRQALSISDSPQIHHVDESNLELEEDGNIPKDHKGVSHVLVCLSSDAGSEGVVTSKSCFPLHCDLKQHERSSIPVPNICRVDASTVNVTSACLNRYPTDQMMCESEDVLDKIVEAVHEAYKVQVESEDIQLATGSNLAEFERVLHAASPVLSPTFSSRNCEECLGGDHPVDLVCRHQIPDHTLGNVWQWYEEPSCYGLKVKVEGCQNSRRLEPNQHESCAYFLPLLSAVQLFSHSSCSSSSRSGGTSDTETMEFQKAKVPDSLSKFCNLPFVSAILPKPSKVGVVNASVPSRLSCSSKASSSSGYKVHNVSCTNQSTGTSCSDGSVLLFEYFESERPQLRKPLFEKIEELVSADGSSSPQMYGSPSCLENLSLRDLHPASWYAVAWYPIYRIPEDSFRAAFLTYHSLGHFSARSSLLKSPCQKKSLVVSPIIGLQRYNDQGECWFSLKASTGITGGQGQVSNPAVVLEKRFSTLEHAASMMSTAAIRKGQHISMNRHSDYEFFVSRKW